MRFGCVKTGFDSRRPDNNSSMPTLSIIIGSLLTLVGAWGYTGSDAKSITALIPAALGVVLIISGALAYKKSRLKTAMHIAAVVSAIGMIMTATSSPSYYRLLVGEAVARPLAVQSKFFTFILCLLFVVFSIRSFVVVRLSRRQKDEASESTS